MRTVAVMALFYQPPRLYLRREAVSPEVVGEVAPVGRVEDKHVGPVARREPADVGEREDVSRIRRAGAQSLRGGEPEAGAGGGHDEGGRFAEGAAGGEVRGEGHDGSLLDEQTSWGGGKMQEQPARREQHCGDVAAGQEACSVFARVLQVVHATGAELGGERYRPALGELVGVHPEREAVVGARPKKPPRLRYLE